MSQDFQTVAGFQGCAKISWRGVKEFRDAASRNIVTRRPGISWRGVQEFRGVFPIPGFCDAFVLSQDFAMLFLCQDYAGSYRAPGFRGVLSCSWISWCLTESLDFVVSYRVYGFRGVLSCQRISWRGVQEFLVATSRRCVFAYPRIS